jgi:hypothetical protein
VSPRGAGLHGAEEVAVREARHHQHDAAFITDTRSADGAKCRFVDLIGEDHGDDRGRIVIGVKHEHLGAICELRGKTGARQWVLCPDGESDALHAGEGDHGRNGDTHALTDTPRPLNVRS